MIVRDITDAELAQLVAENPETTRLDLSDCDQITDAGLAHVAKLSNLTVLDLRGSSITDAGLAHLAKLANLTVLELSDCPKITNMGITVLQCAMPKLKIYGSRKD